MKRFTLKRTLFVRHPEEDFSDDGNNFRIYYYKDKLPISVCVYDGDIYLTMRPDYLGYGWKEYEADFDITDKYNGAYSVRDIDKEQLEKDCEAMYQKYCVERPAQIEKAVEETEEEPKEEANDTMITQKHILDLALQGLNAEIALVSDTLSKAMECGDNELKERELNRTKELCRQYYVIKDMLLEEMEKEER